MPSSIHRSTFPMGLLSPRVSRRSMTSDDHDASALEDVLRDRYLDLMKACLTRLLFMNDAPGRDREAIAQQRSLRESGWDWPDEAETMIGLLRLNCIEECVRTVVR